jgi:ribosomal protein S17
MTVLYGRVVSSTNNLNNHNRNNSQNKGDIINVTKAAARKSILIQPARVKAANTFH